MERNSHGFSLLELLIVISIISLLFAALPITINFRAQVDKGYDTVRKHDLTSLKNHLEEFYADNNRYPTSSEICHNTPTDLNDVCPFDGEILCCNVCGKQTTPDTIKKYMSSLPCDPQYATKDYIYTIPSEDSPQWYILYAKLSLPDINASPSSCQDGCGPENNFQLGLSSDNKQIN